MLFSYRTKDSPLVILDIFHRESIIVFQDTWPPLPTTPRVSSINGGMTVCRTHLIEFLIKHLSAKNMLITRILSFLSSFSSRNFVFGSILVLLLTSSPATALEPEPHPLDTFLTNILNFREPTGIRGTVRYINKGEKNIWLDWEQRSDDRPAFDTGWKLVPEGTTLLVYPQNATQYEELQLMKNGTPIEMIIQLDPEGHRRILSYQDLSQGRKIPL